MNNYNGCDIIINYFHRVNKKKEVNYKTQFSKVVIFLSNVLKKTFQVRITKSFYKNEKKILSQSYILYNNYL